MSAATPEAEQDPGRGVVDHLARPGPQRGREPLEGAGPRRLVGHRSGCGYRGLEPAPDPPSHQQCHEGRRAQAQQGHLGPQQGYGKEDRIEAQLRSGHKEGHGGGGRGAPLIRLRYSGTTPHEQMGNGRPISMPRPACETAPPRSIQCTDRCGRKALSSPAQR